MDDMRAMREARYEASRSRADKPTAAPKPQGQAPPRAEAVPDPPQTGLCGHRAISGRTCTREQGHAAKSHRYS
ncbi:MAG: hypothetical protein M3Y71_19655 [Actinomycetota bacterium]|nr:hypothetical protein [Actinomycetota bacterium]